MTDSSQVCYKISDQRFVLPDQCIFASSTPVMSLLQWSKLDTVFKKLMEATQQKP